MKIHTYQGPGFYAGFGYSDDDDKGAMTIEDIVKSADGDFTPKKEKSAGSKTSDGAVPPDVTLRDLVRDTVADYIAGEKTFSAHTITLAVRDKVNNDGIVVSGLDFRAEGSCYVSDIQHSDVKNIVKSVMDGVGDDTYSSNFNGKYVEYSPVDQDDAETQDDDDDDFLGLGAIITSINDIFTPTPKRDDNKPYIKTGEGGYESQILGYVRRKIAMGNRPTLKSTQSALKKSWQRGKTHSVSTEDIRRVCEKAGFTVDVNSPVANAYIYKS